MCYSTCSNCVGDPTASLSSRLQRDPASAVHDLTSMEVCTADDAILSKLQTGIFQLDDLEDVRVIERMCQRIHAKRLDEPFVLYGCTFTNETLLFTIRKLDELMWQLAQHVAGPYS